MTEVYGEHARFEGSPPPNPKVYAEVVASRRARLVLQSLIQIVEQVTPWNSIALFDEEAPPPRLTFHETRVIDRCRLVAEYVVDSVFDEYGRPRTGAAQSSPTPTSEEAAPVQPPPQQPQAPQAEQRPDVSQIDLGAVFRELNGALSRDKVETEAREIAKAFSENPDLMSSVSRYLSGPLPPEELAPTGPEFTAPAPFNPAPANGQPSAPPPKSQIMPSHLEGPRRKPSGPIFLGTNRKPVS